MPLPIWPTDLLPTSYDLFVSFNTQSGGVSPFDKSEQTLEMPGGKWVARLQFDGLDLAEGRRLSAFVNGLRGRAGRFWWSPPAWPQRGTSIANNLSARIFVANQTGVLLQTTGWRTLQPNIFLPGDLLSWLDPNGRPQLHQVTGDGALPDPNFAGTPSDATGYCSFRVSPPIRRSPNINAALNITAPTGVFKLVKDQVPPSFGGGMYGSCTIDIEEAIF